MSHSTVSQPVQITRQATSQRWASGNAQHAYRAGCLSLLYSFRCQCQRALWVKNRKEGNPQNAQMLQWCNCSQMLTWRSLSCSMFPLRPLCPFIPGGPSQDLLALFPSQRGSRAVTLEPGTDITRCGPHGGRNTLTGNSVFL